MPKLPYIFGMKQRLYPINVPRIVCRYQITKVDDQYWGKAYDQGNNRYPEGDVFTEDRDSAVRNCRHNVNISHNPLSKDDDKNGTTIS